MNRKHWSQTIADDLRAEAARMSEAARGVFADIRQKPRTLTVRERTSQFLNMTREQRQQAYADMGPQEYARFLDDNMNNLISMIGPAAQSLMPYFYADGVPQQQAQDPAVEAEDYLTKLAAGSLDDIATQELLGEPDASTQQ